MYIGSQTSNKRVEVTDTFERSMSTKSLVGESEKRPKVTGLVCVNCIASCVLVVRVGHPTLIPPTFRMNPWQGGASCNSKPKQRQVEPEEGRGISLHTLIPSHSGGLGCQGSAGLNMICSLLSVCLQPPTTPDTTTTSNSFNDTRPKLCCT